MSFTACSVDDNFSPFTAELIQAAAMTDGRVLRKLGSETREKVFKKMQRFKSINMGKDNEKGSPQVQVVKESILK